MECLAGEDDDGNELLSRPRIQRYARIDQGDEGVVPLIVDAPFPARRKDGWRPVRPKVEPAGDPLEVVLDGIPINIDVVEVSELGSFGPVGPVMALLDSITEEVFQMTGGVLRRAWSSRHPETSAPIWKEVSPPDLDQQYPHPGPDERKACAGFSDCRVILRTEAKVAGAPPEWA
jgi:hypothetical protein